MGESRFVKIASLGSTIEAEQMIQFLNENGISAYRKSEIMDLYLGNASVEEDIMVSEKELDFALKIVGEYSPIKTNSTGYLRNFSKVQIILFWIILSIIILLIVIPLVLL